MSFTFDKEGKRKMVDYENYDAIVIGAGHAGSEAGLALARLGHKTLVLSINLEN